MLIALDAWPVRSVTHVSVRPFASASVTKVARVSWALVHEHRRLRADVDARGHRSRRAPASVDERTEITVHHDPKVLDKVCCARYGRTGGERKDPCDVQDESQCP